MQGRVFLEDVRIDDKEQTIVQEYSLAIGEDALVRGPFYYGRVFDDREWELLDKDAMINQVMRELRQLCEEKTALELARRMGENV